MALNMEAIYFSETSATIHQSTRRHISYDLTLQPHCCQNINSRILVNVDLLSDLVMIPDGLVYIIHT